MKINKKTLEALKTQLEGATRRGITTVDYHGLKTAVFCIIQAHGLTLPEAKKIVCFMDIFVSDRDLKKWTYGADLLNGLKGINSSS